MRRLYSPIVALAMLVVLSACTSCATQNAAVAKANPFAFCKTVGQCYLAGTGTYKASQDAAIEILNNPDTPTGVADAIRKADAAATPVVHKGLPVYMLYKHVKADLAKCPADDAPCKTDANTRLVEATTHLQEWLTEATPLINDLLGKVAGESTP